MNKHTAEIFKKALASVLCTGMVFSNPLSVLAQTVPEQEGVSASTSSSQVQQEKMETEKTTVVSTNTPSTAAVLSEKAQDFIDAANALDQKELISIASKAGLAKQKSEEASDDEELKKQSKEAITAWQEAMGTVSDVLDLYDALPEEEQKNAIVLTKFNSMVKLINTIQNAYNHPQGEDKQETPETANTPNISLQEVTDNLYNSLPIAPTGYYIGEQSGMPIATGDTKLSVEEWGSEGDTLDESKIVAYNVSLFDEDKTSASAPLENGKDYAIVPISIQMLYPDEGGKLSVDLPSGVEVIGYQSARSPLTLADDETKEDVLNKVFSETSAIAYGFFVKASDDFTATVTYSNGDESIVKELNVDVDENAEENPIIAYYFGDSSEATNENVDTLLDDSYGISAQTVTLPSPTFTSGIVTSVTNHSGVWMTKLNNHEALCLDKGLYSWAPGAAFSPTESQHGSCSYNFSATKWVDASLYNGNWVHDQQVFWATGGANSGTPATSSLESLNAERTTEDSFPEAEWIVENFPNSTSAEAINDAWNASDVISTLALDGNGISPQAKIDKIFAAQVYAPTNSAWQRIAVLNYNPISIEQQQPLPTVPPIAPTYWELDVKESADAEGESSFTYTVDIDKESTVDVTKLANAAFQIATNGETSGEIEEGQWTLTEAQNITTDSNGHASATFTFSYSVTKHAESDTVRVGPYTTEEECNNAASDKRGELKEAAQEEANAAVADALEAAEEFASSISFHVSEVTSPPGYSKTGEGQFSSPIDNQPGEQDVSVDKNSSATVTVENENWNSHVAWEKIDALTGGRLTEDTQFEFQEWNGTQYVVSPNYKVIRRDDGIYTVQCTNAAYRRADVNGGYSAQKRSDEGNVFYTLTNQGKYRIQEIAPAYGYISENKLNGADTWSVEFTVSGNNDDHFFTKDGNHADKVDANRPWKTRVVIDKVDSETGNQITNDTQFSLYEWNQASGQFVISQNYKIERQGDGTYTVVPAREDWYTQPSNGWLSFEDTLGDARVSTTSNADHTTVQHPKYYVGNNAHGNGTEGRADRAATNDGQFIIVEHTAPNGYFGDWTDIENPNSVSGSDIGKRAYYIRLTAEMDGQTIQLSNKMYNADIINGTQAGSSPIVTANGLASVIITNAGAPKDAVRVYNTDNSRDAANEDSYTMTPKDSVFQNDRVLGEISLSKVDLEAGAYVNGRTANGTATKTGESHGDSTMDGAIYDLYVASDIQHPDGKTGVVNYANIKYANGTNIWHTTMIENAGFVNGSYLPILSKDHLVASTKIENGWLTFANLYLGNYYIVERGKNVVIPVSTSGAYYVDGTYPTVDFTLNTTGEKTPLAVSNGQYTDYVYKNQFTTTAKNRALDGTYVYDGYYESYSNGYLCDEHNYYIAPAYFNESAYVVKTTFEDNRQASGEEIDKTKYLNNYHIIRNNELAESDDQVMKGNAEIDKRESSTGSSDGSPLAGAGFTFYLISDLSKADQINTTRSGAYKLNSLINQYINKEYDEAHPKFDFSKETQAIAKTYEIDAAKIAEYNKTLTAAGDFKNGSGAGWVATGIKNEYQLSEIFTDDVGVARVEGLPYGQYVVVETTVPKNRLQADPFIITINASSQIPQSDMANPKDAVLKPSDAYVGHRLGILNEEVEMYLRIYKKDVETGKTVLRAGTTYQIYWMDENNNYVLDKNGHPRLVTMTSTADGSLNKDVTEFVSSKNGTIALPEKLPVGNYRLVEVQAVSGYYNEWIDTAEYATNGVLQENPDGSFKTGNYYVDFAVTTDRDYNANGTDNENEQDVIVIGEEYWNNETIGQITIRKVGNVLTGYKDGNFIYTPRNLAGAEYTIIAKEDVFTPDNQVDRNGERTVWYKAGDTVATVTTGKEGQVDTVEFAPMRTPATYNFLCVVHDGTLGEVTITLPLGSYTVKETKAPFGFLLTDKTYDFTLSWGNQHNNLVLAETVSEAMPDDTYEIFSGDIVRVEKNARSSDFKKDFEDRVLIYENARELPVPKTPDDEKKVDEVGLGVYKRDKVTEKFVAGAIFNLYTDDDIYDVDGNKLFSAGDLVAVSPATNADGFTYFAQDVPMRGENYVAPAAGEKYNPAVKDRTTNSGNYTIVETVPPLGYFIEETPMHLSFIFDGQAWEVLNSTNRNQPTTTYISKQDLTNDKELPGATLKVVDSENNVFEEWVSTDTPHIIYGLHLNEEYKLIEVRPTPGYAYASDITFKVVQEKDEKGNLIKSNDVYYLSGYKPGLLGVEKVWDKLDKDTVIMKDDITKVSISKVDITNNKELPGAHLTISNKDGIVEEWTSTNEPHYIEKLPAGDYTLTEVTAPDGYLKAENINFIVDAVGDIQHVTMKDVPSDSGILITKVDAKTKKVIEGIDFQIVDSKGNIVQWKDADGNMHDCYNTTNDAGNIWFGLPYGTYFYQEIRWTPEYKGDSTPVMFKIDESHRQVKVVVENERALLYGLITFLKGGKNNGVSIPATGMNPNGTGTETVETAAPESSVVTSNVITGNPVLVAIGVAVIGCTLVLAVVGLKKRKKERENTNNPDIEDVEEQ